MTNLTGCLTLVELFDQVYTRNDIVNWRDKSKRRNDEERNYVTELAIFKPDGI